MNDPIAFIKSWHTVVSAQKSRNALENLLRRYGATGFTVSEDYSSRTVAIVFQMPKSFDAKAVGEIVEIRLPMSYLQVKKRLNAIPAFWRKQSEQWKDEQSVRVAWRHVLLLTEAALMAAALGVQTLEEAFFAHQMVTLPDGNHLRLVDAARTTLRRLKAQNE